MSIFSKIFGSGGGAGDENEEGRIEPDLEFEKIVLPGGNGNDNELLQARPLGNGRYQMVEGVDGLIDEGEIVETEYDPDGGWTIIRRNKQQG